MDKFDEQISKGVKSFLDKNVEFSNTEKSKILQTIEKRSNPKTKKNYPAYWTVLASAAIIVCILTFSFLKDGAPDSELTGSDFANGNPEVNEMKKNNPCVDGEENLKDEKETNETDTVAEKEEISKESTPCEDSEEEKTDNKETNETETVVEEGNVSKESIPVVEKDTETAMQLESLPNAEAEAARWNEVAKDFIARYSEYSYNSSRIHKDEEKSNEEVTIFSHDFKTSLKTSIEYTVNNETKEVTEMRLIGYEQPNADRVAIAHAMSIFISYVDNEVSLTKAGGYLGEIPFATDKEGLYKNEFNGKRYEYVLDLTDGLNMLTYRLGE